MGALTAWLFAGQGSQRRGMGGPLFDRFPEHCAVADAILGYSIRELCLDNPGRRLSDTTYAQPAIYVVGALGALEAEADPPHFVAGHSVGEYAALVAAGALDFETGLRLVKRRAELMAQAHGGGMVAVIDLPLAQISEVLAQEGISALDVANYNLQRQIVLSGPREFIPAATTALERAGARCVQLDVSAAFHSRYMADAAAAFAPLVAGVTFLEPRIPVVSNVTAEPATRDTIGPLLAKQLRAPVRWYDCMRYLRAAGVETVRELGRTRVLSELWRVMHRDEPSAPSAPSVPSVPSVPSAPLAADAPEPLSALADAPARAPAVAAAAASAAAPAAPATPIVALSDAQTRPVASPRAGRGPEQLGSAEFRRDHGVRYAYLAGSMFRGISSPELVVRMAQAGLMGFLGTGGLSLSEVDAALRQLRARLGPQGRYGANLLHQLGDETQELALVDLYHDHGVRCVEASAYTQVTAALVLYRFRGARLEPGGRFVTPNRVIAKLSRPEVAAAFLQPAPEALVLRLLGQDALTPIEAEAARRLPVCQDLAIESDSAGHSDAGVALALLPVMTRLRDEAMARHRYPDRVRIGASGGLGTPEAVAAAFVLGADFVMTGSVNQCTPQAGTSAVVKDLLAALDVQDTGYAPAGDMFELGARVQVVRKGTLFAARGNQLYQLYRQHDSLEAIDQRTRNTIESAWFHRSFEDIWHDTCEYFTRRQQTSVLETAQRDPKQRMALVFRWYFARSIEAALAGEAAERVNFQVHCGPAMGAFNRLVRGTSLEPWHARHVDSIAELLMQGAACVLADHAGRS